MKKFRILIILCILKLTSQQHRVPPGVPPQQYAQHGHGQMQQQHMQHQVPVQHVQHQQIQAHQQQVPMHPQHVPVHQQQVPVQQQQVPVHQQQVPVHQQHVPVHQQVPVQQQQVPVQQQQFAAPQQVPVQHVPQHHQQGQQQLLNVAHMAHENKEHMKEHLAVPIDTSNMSEQELQFHYFKMHDADNNNKLDGCELIKSLIHWHEQGHHHDPAASELPPEQRGSKLFSDQELVSLIDPILSMDDSNRDGFIDYPEFVQAQHKAAATTQQVKA